MEAAGVEPPSPTGRGLNFLEADFLFSDTASALVSNYSRFADHPSRIVGSTLTEPL